MRAVESINKVPGTIFSEKVVDKSVVIEPLKVIVYAPFGGKECELFHTKHAMSLTSKLGIKLLIHIGQETVALEGK